MGEKEQFDALTELAKFRQGRMYDRTRREAQMSFAVWALLTAAIAYIRERPPELMLFGTTYLIFVMHTWFVIEVWTRNRLDGSTAFYYLDRAESLLSAGGAQPKSKPDYVKEMSLAGRDWPALVTRDFWWSGMEIVITFSLSLLANKLVGTALAVSH